MVENQTAGTCVAAHWGPRRTTAPIHPFFRCGSVLVFLSSAETLQPRGKQGHRYDRKTLRPL